MDILALVDRLESLVNGGWRVPFTVRTVIDENVFFDIIDQMRVSIPQELKQANELLEERDRVLAAAAEDAERLIEEAREKAARLLDEHEITAAARKRKSSARTQMNMLWMPSANWRHASRLCSSRLPTAFLH